MNNRNHGVQQQQPYYSNSLAIRQEIQRFESVHPSIYAIYDLLEVIPDPLLAQQIREHVVCIEDSFVNSQEWTLSRTVPDLRLGIVGSLSSGKSALVHRYLTGSYMQDESPEGGRFKKEVVIEGQSYLLLIRDEGGTPELQFSCWVDAVILVFSLENETSFNALYNYYTKMAHFRNAADLPLILVGTQDAISESNPRVIDDARARKLASDLKRCSYYETCATYGLNVERVFQDACQKIVQQKLTALTPTNSRPSTPVGHPLRSNYFVAPGTQAPPTTTTGPSTNPVTMTATGITNNGFSSHTSQLNAPAPTMLVSSQANNFVSASPSHGVNHHLANVQPTTQKDGGVTIRERIDYGAKDRLERPSIIEPQSNNSVSGVISNLISGKDSKELATPCSTPTTSRKTRRRSNLFPPLKKGDDEKKLRNGEVGSGRVIPIRQGYLYKRSCKALNKEWKKKYVTLTNDGRLTYHPSLHDYMDDVHGKEIPLMHTTVKIPGQKPRGSRPAGPTSASASSHQVNELTSDLGNLTVAGGVQYHPQSAVTYHSSSSSSSPLLSTFASKHHKDRERESLLGPSSYSHLHQHLSVRRGSVPLAGSEDTTIGITNANSGVVNGSESHLAGNLVPSTSPLLSKLDTPNVKKRHRRMKSTGAKNLEAMEADSDGYEFIIVSLDNKQWHFEATNTDDREAWVSAIEQQILNSLQGNESCKTKSRMNSNVDQAAVQAIRTSIPGNTHCVDCDAPNPDWASLNLGALMCIECSGIHRNLGSHISRVRSLDLDDWSAEYISVMMALGNAAANSIWEGNTRSRAKPTPNSSREEKERWIRSKYEFKEYLAPSTSSISLGQQLIEAVCKADVKGVALVLAIASAAGTLTEQVNSAVGPRDPRTALHLAAAMGNLPITQLLLWNNANVKATDSDGRTALVYAKNTGTQEVQDLLVHSGCPETNMTMQSSGVNSGTLSRRRGSVSKKSDVFEKLPASII